MSDEITQAVGAPLQRHVRTHTPGPWACFYKHKYDEWHVSVPMSEGSMKWALFDDGVRSESPEADARLIAAAPDLLVALRMLYDETADYIRLNNLGGMDNQCMQLARAALARAVCEA